MERILQRYNAQVKKKNCRYSMPSSHIVRGNYDICINFSLHSWNLKKWTIKLDHLILSVTAKNSKCIWEIHVQNDSCRDLSESHLCINYASRLFWCTLHVYWQVMKSSISQPGFDRKSNLKAFSCRHLLFPIMLWSYIVKWLKGPRWEKIDAKIPASARNLYSM